MFAKLEAFIASKILHYLSAPVARYAPFYAADPSVVRAALKPGDILLVEGNSRVSSIIKFLTQSTWSHAALFIGPRPGDVSPNGEPNEFLEAEAETGVVTTPLSKYVKFNTRICRPVGVDAADIQKVIDYAVARVGKQYELKTHCRPAPLSVSLPASANLVSPPYAGDRSRRSDQGNLFNPDR